MTTLWLIQEYVDFGPDQDGKPEMVWSQLRCYASERIARQRLHQFRVNTTQRGPTRLLRCEIVDEGDQP